MCSTNDHFYIYEPILRTRTPLYGPYLKFTVHKKHISHPQPERNILSSTNGMQFTDRELFYSSIRTVSEVHGPYKLYGP